MTEVKCDLTGETFYLTCGGAVWKGELGNCTKGKYIALEEGEGRKIYVCICFILILLQQCL